MEVTVSAGSRAAKKCLPPSVEMKKKKQKKKWEQGGDESPVLTLNLSLGSINTRFNLFQSQYYKLILVCKVFILSP